MTFAARTRSFMPDLSETSANAERYPDPDPDIRGKLSKFRPDNLKAKRDAWILGARQAGLSNDTIALMLGISRSSVMYHVNKLGAGRGPVTPGTKVLQQLGGHVGHVGASFDRLPVENRQLLFDDLLKTNLTMAEFLLQHYLKTKRPD